ncbi:MAG: HXXEE domain-containing protein [Promethearchaeota archaeon]
MPTIIVEVWFLLLLLMQVLHIFEELGMEVYKIKEFLTIKKYLAASSIIMSISMLTFIAILLELVIGYVFGICVSIFGILNFIVHTVGFIMKKKTKGTIAAGFYTGIVLGIFGSINLFLLFQLI